MQLHEFDQQMIRLKTVYGEKSFPSERERLMFRRFERVPGKAFELAVDWVILAMPTASQVINVLDDKLRDAKAAATPSGQPQYQFTHAPCRDFGWVFDGDLIVHCTCQKSKSVSWEDLKREQGNYDSGRRYFTKEKLAAIFNAAKKDERERSRV